jgi:glutathione-specific gamma-glutamylcyclotransferase
MWIFGYGSLMFDGWESGHCCMRREWADLVKYRRVFGKKSVKNWGTSRLPGLTLNLQEIDNGTCRGVSFEFADNDEVTRPILRYLSKREACEPRILPVLISDQQTVQAHVYIYEGKNVVPPQVGLAQRAAMVASAAGTSGACFDYVRQTFEDLESIGIDDPEVTALWNAVRDLGTKQVLGHG